VPRYEMNREPGTTAEVDYRTSKDVREVVRSHINYVVADTKKWEQSASYILDTHPLVAAFVKNAGLGFAIPYIHNGQPHDYQPDFIVRLRTQPVVELILETKGFDPVAEIKAAAAEGWVAAVNADGLFGTWRDAMAVRLVRCGRFSTAFVPGPQHAYVAFLIRTRATLSTPLHARRSSPLGAVTLWPTPPPEEMSHLWNELVDVVSCIPSSTESRSLLPDTAPERRARRTESAAAQREMLGLARDAG
jgi:hypothetical protein